MFTILARTLILYLVVLFLIRLMGKREVGQLSAFDLVVAIMIAEIAVFPMEQLDIPLYVALVPMLTLVGAEMLFSYIALKSHFLRRLLNGSPSIIIARGKILEKQMRRLRYNINDLLGQLRLKNITDLSDVEYAILETSGELSVVLKPGCRPLTPRDLALPEKPSGLPIPLVFDGKTHQENLKLVGIDESWLQVQLKNRWHVKPEEVLYASLNPDGSLYVSKKQQPVI